MPQEGRRRPTPRPRPDNSPPASWGGGREERVVCFVCDFAVDQLLRQGWRTPARIITLVYTGMKTQKDAALAYCQNNGGIPTFVWRRSTGQNCSQIRLLLIFKCSGSGRFHPRCHISYVSISSNRHYYLDTKPELSHVRLLSVLDSKSYR